jgi:hypothetical protein
MKIKLILVSLSVGLLLSTTVKTFNWIFTNLITRRIHEDFPKFSVRRLIFVSEDGQVRFPFVGLQGETDIPDGDYKLTSIGGLTVEVRNGNSIHTVRTAYDAGSRYHRKKQIPVPVYEIEIKAEPEKTVIYQAVEREGRFREHTAEVENFGVFGFVVGKTKITDDTTIIIVSDELYSKLDFKREYHLRGSAIRTRGHLPYYIKFISYTKAKELNLI